MDNNNSHVTMPVLATSTEPSYDNFLIPAGGTPLAAVGCSWYESGIGKQNF